MLIYHRTSIFESPAQTVVNTVNCVGVMGKGIAAEFRKRYPDMYDEYRRICALKLLEPGKLWLWKAPDRWVLNFPTKQHWRNPSRIEWIESGLKKFVAEFDRRGITEISFPRLGCGNGGLDWEVVRPIMEKYLHALPIQIYVHDYEVNFGPPEHLVEHRGIRTLARIDRSFEDFVGSLRQLVATREGRFHGLRSRDQFEVRFEPDDQIAFVADKQVARIEIDDLRSIWAKLLNGVVTAQAARWDAEVTGDQILSVLSELPDIRAVEIQRRTSEQSEIAVELRHRLRTQLVADVESEKPALAWG